LSQDAKRFFVGKAQRPERVSSLSALSQQKWRGSSRILERNME